MLFSGWEVSIVKNCDRGHSFHYTDQITYLFFLKSSQTKTKRTEKNSRKRYCDRGQR